VTGLIPSRFFSRRIPFRVTKLFSPGIAKLPVCSSRRPCVFPSGGFFPLSISSCRVVRSFLVDFMWVPSVHLFLFIQLRCLQQLCPIAELSWFRAVCLLLRPAEAGLRPASLPFFIFTTPLFFFFLSPANMRTSCCSEFSRSISLRKKQVPSPFL